MTEVDPESIKRTQESLGKFVKKPPLTEKLLKKPPFKFIHDVIKVVSAKELLVAAFFGPRSSDLSIQPNIFVIFVNPGGKIDDCRVVLFVSSLTGDS